jgi:hydrogenase maturation protease
MESDEPDMNFAAVEKIANAVLYEGYVLYPYRQSAVKNQQRFNFGVLYPRQYCALNSGSDDWQMQTECLVAGTPMAAVQVKVRFLQMAEREGWQEGIEREAFTSACELESVLHRPLRRLFSFGATRAAEARRVKRPEGELELRAYRLDEALYKVTLQVRNRSILKESRGASRDHALLLAMVSVHSILHVENGRFISAIDPPEQYQAAAAECRNIGTWPVLAGDEGQTDLMLSAPIILYDYPQIAPESPGDLCDGTEIDEILALRILTLTDEEKREVRDGDERARRILERTELLPPEHFRKLHGALRGLPGPSETTR